MLNTKESTSVDEVQEQVDEFLEGWDRANRGSWKLKAQLAIAALMFLSCVALVGYIWYHVYQFNVLQVVTSLQR